jgi:hypothetical protein
MVNEIEVQECGVRESGIVEWESDLVLEKGLCRESCLSSEHRHDRAATRERERERDSEIDRKMERQEEITDLSHDTSFHSSCCDCQEQRLGREGQAIHILERVRGRQCNSLHRP